MEPTGPELTDTDLLHLMADRADELSLPSWRSRDFEVEIKPDGSPVTTTDPAIEEALLALVAEHRPGDGFLGEEVGAHPGTTGRTWVVDGIDGTRGFVDATVRWSTLIALEVDATAILGSVTSPAIGTRWSTTAAGTAEARPSEETEGAAEPLTVSTVDRLAEATIGIWPQEPWAMELLQREHQALLELVGTPRSASMIVEQPIPHGAVPVADGRIDAMVAFSGQAWDHGAPSAVVAAAGGRFSAVDGRPVFDSGAGVYSNGLLHDELIALLAAG